MQTVQDNQIKAIKNKIFVPTIITVLGSLFTISSFFLPIIQLKGKLKDFLEGYDGKLVNMLTKDIKGISLYKIVKLSPVAQKYGIDDAEIFFVAGLICLFGLLMVTTLILSIAKKPIGVMVFDVFIVAIFFLAKFAVLEIKEDAGRYLTWGIAFYVCCIGIAISFVGSILVLIAKTEKKNYIKAQKQMLYQSYQNNMSNQGYQGNWGYQGNQGYQPEQGYQDYQVNQANQNTQSENNSEIEQ